MCRGCVIVLVDRCCSCCGSHKLTAHHTCFDCQKKCDWIGSAPLNDDDVQRQNKEIDDWYWHEKHIDQQNMIKLDDRYGVGLFGYKAK